MIGGMHLDQADPRRLAMTIEHLRKMDIQKIIPLHCSGQETLWTMRHQLGPRVVAASTGDRIVFEE